MTVVDRLATKVSHAENLRLWDEAAAANDITRAPEDVCLATFWRQAVPGSAYWRTQLPARHLPGQVFSLRDSDVAWDEDRDQLVLPRQRGATAIWQFLGDDQISRVALRQMAQGTRTLMEVDDNYLERVYTPPGKLAAWADTHAQAVFSGLGYSREMHRLIAQDVDGIIVSTPHLAEVYGELNEHVYICPNSIDPADWEDIPRHDDGVFRIGYYGSPTHLQDYPLVKKALKWANRQPGVEVVMMGFEPLGFRGTVMPWVDDPAEARKQLGLLDVGIAPLANTRFSRAKSDVKALEYAMAGVMPLVQRSEAYAPWREPFLADDWVEAIQWAVRDRDYVHVFAREAKEYVLAERTIKKNIIHWQEAIFGG